MADFNINTNRASTNPNVGSNVNLNIVSNSVDLASKKTNKMKKRSELAKALGIAAETIVQDKQKESTQANFDLIALRDEKDKVLKQAQLDMKEQELELKNEKYNKVLNEQYISEGINAGLTKEQIETRIKTKKGSLDETIYRSKQDVIAGNNFSNNLMNQGTIDLYNREFLKENPNATKQEVMESYFNENEDLLKNSDNSVHYRASALTQLNKYKAKSIDNAITFDKQAKKEKNAMLITQSIDSSVNGFNVDTQDEFINNIKSIYDNKPEGFRNKDITKMVNSNLLKFVERTGNKEILEEFEKLSVDGISPYQQNGEEFRALTGKISIEDKFFKDKNFVETHDLNQYKKQVLNGDMNSAIKDYNKAYKDATGFDANPSITNKKLLGFKNELQIDAQKDYAIENGIKINKDMLSDNNKGIMDKKMNLAITNEFAKYHELVNGGSASDSVIQGTFTKLTKTIISNGGNVPESLSNSISQFITNGMTDSKFVNSILPLEMALRRKNGLSLAKDKESKIKLNTMLSINNLGLGLEFKNGLIANLSKISSSDLNEYQKKNLKDDEFYNDMGMDEDGRYIGDKNTETAKGIYTFLKMNNVSGSELIVKKYMNQTKDVVDIYDSNINITSLGIQKHDAEKIFENNLNKLYAKDKKLRNEKELDYDTDDYLGYGNDDSENQREYIFKQDINDKDNIRVYKKVKEKTTVERDMSFVERLTIWTNLDYAFSQGIIEDEESEILVEVDSFSLKEGMIELNNKQREESIK